MYIPGPYAAINVWKNIYNIIVRGAFNYMALKMISSEAQSLEISRNFTTIKSLTFIYLYKWISSKLKP